MLCKDDIQLEIPIKIYLPENDEVVQTTSYKEICDKLKQHGRLILSGRFGKLCFFGGYTHHKFARLARKLKVIKSQKLDND